MEQPSLLFISPVMPAPTGSGIAMRAFSTVRALSNRYRVHLVVTAPAMHRLSPSGGLPALCASIASVPVRPWREPVSFLHVVARRLLGVPLRSSRAAPSEWRALSSGRVRHAAAAAARAEFDVIHVFRLYCAPFARPFAARSCIQLDLDDVESTTRRDLAALARAGGRAGEAARWERDAAAYEELERRLLRSFDRVFVASEGDAAALVRRRVFGRPEVLPNVMTPVEPAPPTPVGSPFTFLFVGSLAYGPNRDAVLFLCEMVMPHLGRRTGRPFVVELVGGGLSRADRRRLQAMPEIRLTGPVDELAPAYARASAVVVPVRAGGGTRIKTLEAFAHRRPVVSTPKGVEGLGVRPGVHALVADNAEAFAEDMAWLMDSPSGADALAERAHRFVKVHHDPARLEAVLVNGAGSG